MILAADKNEIVRYSTTYSHLIPINQSMNLAEFADMIEQHYCKRNANTKQVCTWLHGTYGSIERDRTGDTKLQFIPYTDEENEIDF
jgi:hypothetical protein